MGLFNRKRTQEMSPSSSRSTVPQTQDGANPMQYDWSAKADPAVLDNVRSEWDMSDPDYKDPRAWGNGMHLFDTGPPGQRFNAAEYMSRGFCNVLFDPSFMDDASVAVTIERMLQVFDTCEIQWPVQAEIAAKRLRLALTVMRERGWQPKTLGGSGQMGVNLDTQRIRASLACSGASADKSLEHFFGLA
jgi:hypothetical protein